ncbi:hypothetical protein F8O06_09690 [Pseudoclavibacter sp. CFCC 14310]|uniref:hypothetical protein n=1 Tax=Pseudoclavibacter sp. CFCC 14310 TaxID=2615180 RepID=UPI00130170C2|nr:hypothetical protein [Pseudoclavibacter sp. CFCC 14310]KAB1644316.1 hypothetical protein F8O06_09690 [Pseudoclavibacter sp. CFCC 14310]
MPTYILKEGTRATLRPAPVMMSVRVEGDGASQLVARGEMGDLPGLVRPRSDMLIIPNLIGSADVLIEPVNAASFPSPSKVSLTLTTDAQASADPVQVVLNPTDAAGLSSLPLLHLERTPEGIVVTGLSTKETSRDLGELGGAARVVAAKLLGTTHYSGVDASGITLLVDDSASMRQWAESGDARGALEVFDGVAEVVAGSLRRTWLQSADDRIVPVQLAAEQTFGSATNLTASPSNAPVDSGAPKASTASWTRSGFSIQRYATALQMLNPGERVFVLTDALPADALQTARRSAGLRIHYLVLGDPAAVALQQDAAGLCTAFDCVRRRLQQTLKARPEELGRIVRSLLGAGFALNDASARGGRS